MTHRTLVQSSFEAYVAGAIDSPDFAREETRDRLARLKRFPYSVMLELAFPELDYAERWCSQRFGPMDGECRQHHSEYRICSNDTKHTHTGKWTSHWYEKTDYNFGYCEFYFVELPDRDAFLEELPEFNWGEHYPK